MAQEGMSRIKTKLQELLTVIKEEAAEESKDAREDILKAVNEMKQTLEEKWQDVEGQSKNKIGNLNEIVNDLEGKALKVQYKLQEKYSQSVDKKDEVVNKAADGLVDAVKKVKGSLLSKK